MVSNRGPSAYQPNALPLGQTGSHVGERPFCHFALRPQKQGGLFKLLGTGTVGVGGWGGGRRGQKSEGSTMDAS